jgi:hypothetical protein
MALTQINGNQISTSTQALITQLSFLNSDSILRLPAGTTAQRPTGVSFGTLRFNTTEDKVEVYVNKKRRADILLPNNVAIEFQNSPISIENVIERNNHHKDGVIWVHNFIEQTMNKQFFNKKEIKKGLYRALWKNPTLIFDRHRFRGEEIYFQFSEQTLGKICWVDYSTKPYTSFSFYLETHSFVIMLNLLF